MSKVNNECVRGVYIKLSTFRFREGIGNGGWLRHTELIATPQQAGVVLTAAVHSHSHLHMPLLHTSGFTVLAWLVSRKFWYLN